MSAPTATEVLDRLEILWRKLEDEGMYVQANTVYLAIEEIKALREMSLNLTVSLDPDTLNPEQFIAWCKLSSDKLEPVRPEPVAPDAVERSPRHYDSQGYCDNPSRGY
jgi:hypothetical protein